MAFIVSLLIALLWTNILQKDIKDGYLCTTLSGFLAGFINSGIGTFIIYAGAKNEYKNLDNKILLKHKGKKAEKMLNATKDAIKDFRNGALIGFIAKLVLGLCIIVPNTMY